MLRNLILVLFLITTPLYSFSQLPMGKWSTHIAYNSVDQLAQSANKIYAVSEGALFSVNKSDGEMEFYSKLSGLNDVGISQIEYDSTSSQLLIIYSDGNIDLMSNEGIVNLPDLYNKQLNSNKTVNDIFFYNNKAYLSCGFGVLVLNMQKKEVADTYFLGSNGSSVDILSTFILNGQIYAADNQNVYIADANNQNLVNYEFWSTMLNLPGDGDIKKLCSFNGELVLYRGTHLYVQNKISGQWSAILNDLTLNYVGVSNDKLIALDSNDQLYYISSDFIRTKMTGIKGASDLEYDTKNQTYWVAALSQGLKSYNETASPKIGTYKPVGPAVNSPWSMTFSKQRLFVVPGGRWDVQYNRPAYVMIYENSKWTNIADTAITKITNGPALDFVNMAVDPTDSAHFFVTSYGNGLFEFKNDQLYKWYNLNNSVVESVIPTDPLFYTRLDGITYDKDGNLFLCNTGVGASIKILLKSGKWVKLNYPNAANPDMGQVVISNQNPNQKWIPSARFSPGILIFDDGGTLEDQNDDKTTFLSSFVDTDTQGGIITPTTYYCIAQDKNGVMWVGTEQGPLLFYNPNDAFKSGYTCSRVKIPRNDGTNLADYLLSGEKVKAIAIDGANRKWLGTEGSGVYLMSADGLETIKHFTTANSPLLSNDILSIAINPVSGEVFFGTSMGIVSYQSDASEANETFTDVHAYPNPVRQNFNGLITITGLMENTQIKITDITGNLICQTVSNGSLATWNGKDITGKKVSTGIYLVICVNSDGTQSAITKIMVIN